MSDPKYSQLELQHFDQLLPRKPMLRAQEVADIIGISDSMVEKLAEIGRLQACELNAGKGLRMTRRYPRSGIVLFLLQSKTYPIEDYLAGVIGLLGQLSLPELCRVQAHLPDLLARAQARSGMAPKTGVGGPLPRGNGQFAPK